METPPKSPNSGSMEAPPLEIGLTEERSKCHSPLAIQTPKLAVLTDLQLDSLNLSADNFEDPFSVDINDLEDGFSAEEIFEAANAKGYTFDDLIVLPGHIDFGVDDVKLDTRVTKRIKLTVPFVSSPMDTVTEEAMAVGMALNGGFGFIHGRCSIEVQAARVKAVKSFQNGFIARPACMKSDQKISDLDLLRVGGVPITEDGKIGSKLIGLVEKKDCDFIEDRSLPLSSVLTPVANMITCQHPCTLAEANKTLMDAKANYLCVVDKQGCLKALTTRRDLIKNRDYPTATSTENGSLLLVGAAVSLVDHEMARSGRPSLTGSPSRLPQTSPRANQSPYGASSSSSEYSKGFVGSRLRSTSFGSPADKGNITAQKSSSASSKNDSSDDLEEEYQTRSRALVAAGVDVIVVDCLHGDTVEQAKAVIWLKKTFGEKLEVVGGNVATASQAKRLLDAGVDGLRVGMGTGSVATAQEVKACGRAQLSAVFNCVRLARKYDVPVIADGGITSTGAALKALSMGASCVMMGSLLAGVSESPGEYYFEGGMRLKKYYGMTSGHSTPSSLVSGVSGAVVDKGSIHSYIPYLSQAVKHGLQDMGAPSLTSLWSKLLDGSLRFEMRTPSAQKEGKVHDLHSFTTKLYAAAK